MRNKWILIVVLAIASSVLALENRTSPTPAAIDSGVVVFFSPNGGCEAAVVEQIGKATRTIDVQAYSFTNKEILAALVEAKNRGVKIRLVLDKSNETDRYTGATFMMNHGVTVMIDGEHAIAHNKIMIIDMKTVITGSFNFTASAEDRNAENLLIITGKPKLTAAYANNFSNHLAHSKAYTGPKKD